MLRIQIIPEYVDTCLTILRQSEIETRKHMTPVIKTEGELKANQYCEEILAGIKYGIEIFEQMEEELINPSNNLNSSTEVTK